jgi:hypothetical protein
MYDDAFSYGYLDGWRLARGDKEQPAVPPAPAVTGMSMYLVGFHRGVRDANTASMV